jgi:hypothetical protein
MSKTEPREFAIWHKENIRGDLSILGVFDYCDKFHSDRSEYFHVIEHQAYLEAQEEIKRLREALEHFKKSFEIEGGHSLLGKESLDTINKALAGKDGEG